MDGRFDRDYYQRFYRDPASRVVSRAEMNARGRLIGACALHIGLPVKRVLDAGCGVGLLRTPLKRVLPRAEYTGIEVSAWLCRKYGWTQSTIEGYGPRSPSTSWSATTSCSTSTTRRREARSQTSRA